MRKHPYIKRLLPLLLGVLFLFIDVLPIYSQSSLNACFQSAAAATECAQAGLISPQTAANAVRGALTNPSPVNPLVNSVLPSKEVVAIVGGVAALHYLRPQDMAQLKESAPTTSQQYYLGRWYIANINGTNITGTMTGTPVSAGNYEPIDGWGTYKIYLFQSPNVLTVDNIPHRPITWVNVPDSAFPVPAATPNYDGVSNDKIYAAAAAAAAVASREAAGRKDVAAAQAAAAAAAAAAGLVPAGSADKAAADAAAAAAAAAAADAADPTKAPDTPQAKPIAFSKTNFLAYAVSASGFGNKFPFGMFAPLPAGAAMSCPSFNSWGKTVELCFIRDIIMLIKYIVWVRFAIYSFVNL